MKKGFWIYLVLTLSVIAGIFCFSAQSGEESSEISMNMTKRIVDEQKNEEISKKELNDRYETVETVIRKTAHFLIYTALGFFVFMALYHTEKVNKKSVLFIISLIFCIIYASSDEIHQLFVSERSGEVRDVFIDSAGSAIGIFIAFIIRKTKDERQKARR